MGKGASIGGSVDVAARVRPRDARHARIPTVRAGRATTRLVAYATAAGTVQAFSVGYILHRLHDDPNETHEAVYVTPVVHWLRDSALAAPGAIVLLIAATLVSRRIMARGSAGQAGASMAGYLVWAAFGAAAYALASVPAAMVHARLFSAHHEEGSYLLHSAEEAVLTLRYSFALLLGIAALAGLPWTPRTSNREDR